MKNLRVILFVLFLIMLIIFNLNGMEYEQRMSLKMGVNISSFWGDDQGSANKSKIGFIGGVAYNRKLSEHFSLQGELLFTMKGDHASAYDVFPSCYDDYSFNYIELPILIRYCLLPRNYINPGIYFGPAVSYNTYAKGVNPYIDQKGYIDEYIKKFDFGIVFGIQTNFLFDGAIFDLDIRCDLSLTEFDDQTMHPNSFDLKNSAVSLILGFPIWSN